MIIPKSADAGMIRTVDEILSDLEAERAESEPIGRQRQERCVSLASILAKLKPRKTRFASQSSEQIASACRHRRGSGSSMTTADSSGLAASNRLIVAA